VPGTILFCVPEMLVCSVCGGLYRVDVTRSFLLTLTKQIEGATPLYTAAANCY
jgi:hypothetical protein